jgi:hypothetical protein
VITSIFIAAASLQRYTCSAIKQPYLTALSAALACLALQGALSWLGRPRDPHSAPEIYTNFDPFPAITEYKRGETSTYEQKRDHLVIRREWLFKKNFGKNLMNFLIFLFVNLN